MAIIRDGRLVRLGRIEDMRDLAHHQVELQFAGTVPSAAFEALDGVSQLEVDGQHLKMRVSGSIAPVVRAAASYDVLDFVSREPSLEETFLAEYSDAAKVA